MSSSGNGQLRPAASNRRMVSRTVEGAAPIRRAISRLGSPAAFILITSRTRRVTSLSVGIQGPPSQSRKGDLKGARRGLVTRIRSCDTPGDIIPEWWATSNRKGGRDHLGKPGDTERNPHTLSSVFVRCLLGTRLKLHDRSVTDTQSSHFRPAPVNIGGDIRMRWSCTPSTDTRGPIPYLAKLSLEKQSSIDVG
ncbi:hypothetical protein ACVILK_003264 [Bradyrhizobium embrapense]